MKHAVKKSTLFVDSLENGWARLLTQDKTAFTMPVYLLPDGAREGLYVEIAAQATGAPETRSEIDGLLDDLGDIASTP
ncbi:MAG: DUF3006 domain-containing protein [Cloacibacillus sp.]